jgi:outer membrane protein assembly factor BamE (lipoprotein component of BamABCDE complex)
MRLNFSLVACVLILSACQPFVNSRGNALVAEHIGEFKVGQTTSNEVLEKCGTPSLHRDNWTWIYIGYTSEEVAFKKVDAKNKFVVRMRFDQNKILRSIEKMKVDEDKEIFTNDEITELITDKQATENARNAIKKSR